MSAIALRRFVRAHSTVPGPADRAVSCARSAGSCCAATASRVLDLARAMLGQLATFHSPDDLRDRRGRRARAGSRVGLGQVAAARPARARRPTRPAPVRLVFEPMAELEEALADELAERPRHSPEAKPLTTGAAPARGPRRRRGRRRPASCTAPGLLGTTVHRPVRRGAARRRPLAAVPGRDAPSAVDVDQGNRRTPLGRPDRLTRRAGRGAGPPARAVPAVPAADRRPRSRWPRSMELPDLLGVGDAAAVDPRDHLAAAAQPGAAAHPARRRPGRRRRSSSTSRSRRRRAWARTA